MEKMIITELTPVNGRKSFNHKAKLLQHPKKSAYYLLSYDTIVASIEGGKVRRFYDGEKRVTTSTHLAAFFDACGVRMTAKEFFALPCETAPTLGI